MPGMRPLAVSWRSEGAVMTGFSDYIVYADESGDHGLVSINPESPVFALAFCIFHKTDYIRSVVPRIQEFKFRHWGHDCIVLHGHEIRKEKGEFRILNDLALRPVFLDDLTRTIADCPFTLIVAAIRKQSLLRYPKPGNPYEMALLFCMERLQRWLEEQGQANRITHILVEKRGDAEDKMLALEFQRIVDGGNGLGKRISNLAIRFMDKKHNSTGLQLADLVAYPVARHVIKPLQPNRAFDVIEPKFRRNAAGVVQGYGLKIFP